MTSSPASRDALPALTGLRFWAALLVVLYHLSRRFGPLPLLGPLTWYGRDGVTLFFVLSGFVLAWTYHGSPVGPLRCYRRRLARIWPLHAVTTAASLAVYAALGAAVPLTAGLWSLTLLHPWLPALAKGGNPASWSLGDEAFFYLLLPWLLVLLGPRRRWWRPLGLLCALAGPLLWSAGALVADPALRWWALDYLPLARLPQFLLGVLAALAVRSGHRLGGARWWALGVLSWHAVLVPWSAAAPDQAWYGPYSAAQLFPAPLYAGLITALARPTGPALLASRWARRLGHWSFAWYLCHEIVLRCWPPGHAVLGRLLPAPLALALAGALHHLVEAPAERRLRGEGRPVGGTAADSTAVVTAAVDSTAPSATAVA
ncbi:acyltransferase family protein, partial [Kitasatospora sp. NPDC058965]|uniref:acyltransferase family protein n=1 Tax=Kitasatospora sp. NPDC058965 TaxID=3346682 RepID=UPI003678F2E0